MAKTLRVGIIGANAEGGWARDGHVPAVQALDGLEFAAVATNSRKTADASARAFGVPAAYGSGMEVVVNDLGGGVDGAGGSGPAAQAVADEIAAAGGEAVADGASVADMGQVEAMVASAMERWGRIDILVNNARILRDRSFAKMGMADFRAVVDVHLMGAAYCTKAAWDIMRAQNYGRVVLTTSSSGLYGNFGQARAC